MPKTYSADQIIELEFMDAIRLRPGMYIGNNNLHGLHHILLEVLDNSVDECMAEQASKIVVHIEKDGAVSIADDGRGIPVEYKRDSKMSALSQVMVKAHAGGKFGGEESAYSSSGGLHGIGIKTTNAFSSLLEAEVRRYGLVFRQRFENGGVPVTEVDIYDATKKKVGAINADTSVVLNKKGIAQALTVRGKPVRIKADPTLKTGTRIRFRPNRAWFAKEMEWPESQVPWDGNRLETRFRQIACLYPGVRIEFLDERLPKAEQKKKVFYSEYGLLDYLEWLTEGEPPLHKPIHFKIANDIEVEGGKATITTEVALQYAGEETQIYSFANAIPTPLGGTHVSAFKAALTKAIKQFAVNKRLIKSGDDFKGDDVLLGLTAILNITMTNTPQFLSQTKESLTSPEVNGPIFSATYEAITRTLESPKNYGTGKLIVNQAQAAAHGREAAAQARKLVIKRSAMEAGEFVLGKLADIQRRGGVPSVPLEHTALYLVEGDSAGGSCKQGRDSRYHAILPLRGKIPNVQKGSRLNEMLKNNEIAAIVAAVGAGVAPDFDLDSMRYGRVAILTDADTDGAHIATLLLTLFWRIMRPLIDSHRLYIAVPPLYQIRAKDRGPYAYSEQERGALVAKLGGPEAVTVQRYKGLGEMNPEQLRETVFVVPEGLKRTPAQRGPSNGSNGAEFSINDFAHRELRVTVDDVHDTNKLIEKLMGSAVEPRKDWLMQISWDEKE